jgi:hypothetical protein
MKSNLQKPCFFSRLQKGTMLCEWRRDNTGNKSSCTSSRAFGFCTNHILHMTVDGFHVSCSCPWLFQLYLSHLLDTVFLCLVDKFITRWISYWNQQGKKHTCSGRYVRGFLPPRTMYIRVTLYWAYLIILWLFHFGVSCTVVVLTCFVMCGCV